MMEQTNYIRSIISMCFSFKTSIISYTLGMASAAFALYTGQLMLGVLILFYSQMQLAEALIWRGIDTNDLDLNRAGTSYGKYLLPTHNVALGIGLLLSIVLIQKRTLKLNDFVPLVVGVIFYGIIMMLYARGNFADTTFPANQCAEPKDCQSWGNRLRWPFPHSWYMASYFISLIILFFYYDGPINSKIFLCTAFSVLLISTAYVAPRSVGSLWCASTALAAPIIVGVNWLLTRQ
jgi:hypothetical protein